MKRYFSIIFVCCWLHIFNCWDAIGHSITTNIALRQLSRHQVLFFRKYLNYSSNETFTHASIWPDAIREITPEFDNWHYNPICFVKDPAISCPTENKTQANSFKALQRAVLALTNLTETLENQKFYFRFVLHLVGDIHQPLHNIRYFSKELMDGDFGANKITIKYQGNYTNLHRFWDNLCHLEKTFKIEKNLLLKNLIISDFKSFDRGFNGDFQKVKQWMSEAYEIAVNNIYDESLLRTRRISREYLVMCKRISLQQIILGGLRLASVLDYVWRKVTLLEVPGAKIKKVVS